MKNKFKLHIITLIILISIISQPITVYCDNDYEYVYGVNNLLLIGKNDKSKPHCNFFIVLTIDSINKKLTLTSLNKHTLVCNYNRSLYEMYLIKDEIYLVDTVSKVFDINIDNYVVINEKALSKIVDSTGTVQINSKIASGDDVLNLLDSKKYLDVYQQEKAQLYMIQELLYGFSRLPFSLYPHVIKETFPYVTLNITPFRMLSLGFTALSLENYTANIKYLN